MTSDAVVGNITNPTILYFLLGSAAVAMRSTLSIPEQISKFLSLYLLFSIGFRGGLELAHSAFTTQMLALVIVAVALSFGSPWAAFQILKRKLKAADAGAIGAAYGSVSAVTFVTASSFLDDKSISYSGHMVAIMAMMEAPAIISSVLLIRRASQKGGSNHSLGSIVREAVTNGSVVMILGSLLIGLLSDARQAATIKPFASDIFKGFLALFLLDMGMVAARRLAAFRHAGGFLTLFGILFPAAMASVALVAARCIGLQAGDGILLCILAGSASYIAVPAAMRLAVPEADPGLYIPMALGITFPFNLLVGIPLYTALCQRFLL